MGKALKAGCGCVGFIVIGIAGLVFMLNMLANSDLKSPGPAVVTIDHSTEKQAARKELLGNLIARGIFTKIEQPADLPHAYVGPAFYELTIDDKQTFAGVVYAYYFDGSDPIEHVRLFDGRSGKQIGDFGSNGLSLD